VICSVCGKAHSPQTSELCFDLPDEIFLIPVPPAEEAFSIPTRFPEGLPKTSRPSGIGLDRHGLPHRFLPAGPEGREAPPAVLRRHALGIDCIRTVRLVETV
jgi:hypothetical protein